MNPEDHYFAAESCLNLADQIETESAGDEPRLEEVRNVLLWGQVHALLAQHADPDKLRAEQENRLQRGR